MPQAGLRQNYMETSVYRRGDIFTDISVQTLTGAVLKENKCQIIPALLQYNIQQ